MSNTTTTSLRRFWNWTTPTTEDDASSDGVRVLHLNGAIAEESWFDDDTTPAIFKEELHEGRGDVEVWVNGPGGDCIAAAQIYNMLLNYPGRVTVIIDGLAASAASVIAMAGERVVMSPVSMMMIHNPATLAIGDTTELSRAIEMLGAVKESIINAYELKTGLSRAKISKLMDAETWMDARAAVDLGFADDILTPTHTQTTHVDGSTAASGGVVFNRLTAERVLVNKLTTHQPPAEDTKGLSGVRVVDALASLVKRTR